MSRKTFIPIIFTLFFMNSEVFSKVVTGLKELRSLAIGDKSIHIHEIDLCGCGLGSNETADIYMTSNYILSFGEVVMLNLVGLKPQSVFILSSRP